MKGTIAAALLAVFCAWHADAAEMQVPLGTRIEGVAMNGIYAAEGVPSPFPIKIFRNPVAAGVGELKLKDCIVLGDVLADMTVKRAFFTASRIICPNSKEPNGVLLKGYAVDSEDNRAGIKGAVHTVESTPKEPAAAQPKGPATAAQDNKSGAKAAGDAAGSAPPAPPIRYMEIDPDRKVILFLIESVSIAIKQ